jgi:hypothetical protein
MSIPYVDHVAVVVASVAEAASRLARFDVAIGPVEAFPHDGTREVYIGERDEIARLLLIEPLHPDTPYGRALARRGPGLHHLGVMVPDVEAFALAAHEHGWYLHPRSLRTMRDAGTAWLVRPGAAPLLEVRESRKQDQRAASLITRIEIVLAPGHERLMGALGHMAPGTATLHGSPDVHAWLTVRGERIPVDELAVPEAIESPPGQRKPRPR